MSLSGQQNTSSRVQPVMGNGTGVLIGMNAGNILGTSKLMWWREQTRWRHFRLAERGELWRGTVTWRHRQTEILCGLAEKWEESQRDHGDYHTYDINEMDTKFAKMFAN